MKGMRLRPDALGVAQLYRDFVDVLVLDRADAGLAASVERLGIRPVVANTLFDTPRRRRSLARRILRLL
jgi:hypothetical protein